MTKSISIEGLSKRYELGALQQETQLRDQLVRLLRSPFRKRAPKEILWALRDVSFQVDHLPDRRPGQNPGTDRRAAGSRCRVARGAHRAREHLSQRFHHGNEEEGGRRQARSDRRLLGLAAVP